LITSIQFQNFRALRDAILPLGPFTLIVGPNGSGKSTAMEAFTFILQRSTHDFVRRVSVDLKESKNAELSVRMNWRDDRTDFTVGLAITKRGSIFKVSLPETEDLDTYALVRDAIASFRLFAFDANAIAAEVETSPHPELGQDGSNLAAVLDSLRDTHPERFEELNKEFHRCLPEFDRILFETPTKGKKSFLVRTAKGHHRLRAADLSQGVLFALAFLTLAYLPDPPAIVCFEEPDRGIHPRLLVDIRDAMYRLAFPEKYGEKRKPVQVIATSHSPYLLDLYREHPEQIVIAHKDEQGTHFERLSEKPHLNEILEGAPLGDIWFSGILGGVPQTP